MALAIEVRQTGSSHWERIETTDDNAHFPDVLHRTYEAMIKTGAGEAALILLPGYKALTVFQKSDIADKWLTYFRYQEACSSYGRLSKKIHDLEQAAGRQLDTNNGVV